jgi:hypothetical protein
MWIWCHDVTMFMTKEIDSSGYWDQLCSEKQCESHWSMWEDLEYEIEEWLSIIAFRRMNDSRKERVVIFKKITKKCLLLTEGQSELAYAVSLSAFWVCLLTNSVSICSCASSSSRLKSELSLSEYASRHQLYSWLTVRWQRTYGFSLNSDTVSAFWRRQVLLRHSFLF